MNRAQRQPKAAARISRDPHAMDAACLYWMASEILAMCPAQSGRRDEVAEARVDSMVREHFSFVWRNLRRLGLSAEEADDAAQHVFVTAARKLDVIEPTRERPFLFATAVRVAASARRKSSRQRLMLQELAALTAEAVSTNPEELVGHRQRRAFLDALLDELPLELRVVVVLSEIEQLTKNEIAELLGVRPGTVASRLRRGRQQLRLSVHRLRTRYESGAR
jgi:RNA polymerase sigma-70 factor (ECF subfamily)